MEFHHFCRFNIIKYVQPTLTTKGGRNFYSKYSFDMFFRDYQAKTTKNLFTQCEKNRNKENKWNQEIRKVHRIRRN